MTYGRPGVYINERLLPAPVPGAGNSNAAGACIGNFAQGPTTLTLVTSWYDFVRQFGGVSTTKSAALGVNMFFQNGGSELYVRRVVGAGSDYASVDVVDADDAVVFTVTALNVGTDGNNYRVTTVKSSNDGATPVYYTVTVTKEAGVAGSGAYGDDTIVEQFNFVRLDDATSSDFITNVVNNNSKVIQVSDVATTLVPVSATQPLAGGLDGSAPVLLNYTNAIDDFSAVDRPLVLFAPEILSDTAVGGLGETDGASVQDSLIQWATANGKGFVVLDTPVGLTATEAVTYAGARTGSSNAAVYYPNLYITDPLGRGTTSLRKVGPAGAIAGLYLQTDKQTGPFKAPAGITASVRGAVALEKAFTSAELDTLNTGNSPVNAIRNLPGTGIVSMGARTLLQDGTANRYVNMRRSLIYIRQELNSLTQFALFENNDDILWAKLRTAIGVFLSSYYNMGGLRGASAEQAFYVKVDKENNPIDAIARGEVHIEVGVALEYPTEFVVITLSQTTGL